MWALKLAKYGSICGPWNDITNGEIPKSLFSTQQLYVKLQDLIYNDNIAAFLLSWQTMPTPCTRPRLSRPKTYEKKNRVYHKTHKIKDY